MAGNVIRISCPSSNLGREERIEMLLNSIGEWCRADELAALFAAFNVDLDYKNLPLHELIELENKEASRLWDLRKKTSDGKRSEVIDTQEILEKEEIIMTAAKVLGLLDITKPLWKPDYILPLGGARLTNLVRPYMARFLIDKNNWRNIRIVALSAYRDKWDVDEPFYDQYAPKAKTEFDAMCAGLEIAFNLSGSYEEKGEIGDCLYASSSIKKYTEKYEDCSITAIAAPSEDKNRWANSRETYEYFLSKYRIEPGRRILLLTSEIYVPTQALAFMDLAIEHQIEVDCIGVDPIAYDEAISRFPKLVNQTSPGGAFSKTANYLQEIKSTIDRIYSLIQRLAKSE